MAADQGYAGDYEISTDDTTYYSVSGANTVSQNLSRAMLEVTDFDDTAINRIAGLFDTPCSIGGHRDPDDSNGQEALITAWLAGTTVYVRCLPDGTNGFKVACLVENVDFSSSPDGTAQVTFNFQSIAAPTQVS